jgi:hypothetical protein
MHTRQWIGTYAGRGNGDYRRELASALQAITVAPFALRAHSGVRTGRVSTDNMAMQP